MRRSSLPVLAAALVACVLVVVPRAAPARDALAAGSTGPLVGHVDDRTAEVWFQPADGPTGPWQVVWWPTDRPHAALGLPLQVRPPEQHALRARLVGLEPATAYIVQVRRDGRTSPWWTGRFRTAPPPGTPGRFRLAVASCMKPEWDASGWRRLLAEDPDRLLLLGDNVYADTTDPGRTFKAHRTMRGVPAFAAVVRNVPTLATWDDHDYAGNDADGTEPGRWKALGTFQTLWANPSYGLPDGPGTYFSFSYGDVDVFVLDVRFHRSPNRMRDGPEKSMLGRRQFQWLVEGLAASRARFKAIASGSSLDGKPDDAWSSFGHERRRLFAEIARRRVPGVVWLSGDLHRSFVKVHPAAGTGFYDLVEIVSSGIANAPDTTFAVLDFDTAAESPTLDVRVLGGDGVQRQAARVPAARLVVP